MNIWSMMLEMDPTRAVIHKQGAKKVVSNSLGLVDFVVALVDSFRQVKFLEKCFEEIQITVFTWVSTTALIFHTSNAALIQGRHLPVCEGSVYLKSEHDKEVFSFNSKVHF